MFKRGWLRILGLKNASVPPDADRETTDRSFLLALLPKQSIGAEIGVHMGDFSAQLLEATQPACLHLIDPWHFETSDTYKEAWYGGQSQGGQSEMDARYASVQTRFASEIAAGRVEVHRGYSNDVLDTFADGSLDWIYIDGNHLYEFVKQDLDYAFRKVRAGGWITGDDYQEGGWWEGGVKKAVDEFATRATVQVVAIRNGQFVLQK